MENQIFELTNYSLKFFSILPIFVSVLAFLIGIVVLLHENFSKESILFSLIAFGMTGWLIIYGIMLASNNGLTALFWAKLGHIAIVFLPTTIFLGIIAITNQFRRGLFVFTFLSICSLIFILTIFRSNLLITGMKKYNWGFYPQYGIAGIALIIIFIFAFIKNFYYLSHSIKNSNSIQEIQRVRLIRIAYIIGYLGTIDFIPSFGINIYPFGFILIFTFLCVFAKAISRYNLVDINPSFAAKQIIKSMNEILILTDRTGIIRLLNPSAEKFFKSHEYKLAGKHISNLINDPFFQRKDANELLNNLENIKEREIIYSNQKNERKFLSLTSSILKDSKNFPIGIVLIFIDTTESKESQENLKKTYKSTETIIEGLPAGIVIINKGKKIIKINKTAIDILHETSKEDIINKICSEKICKSMKESCPIFDHGKNNFTKEETFSLNDGTKLSVIKTAYKINLNDEEVILEAFVDITDRKIMEQKLTEYKNYLEELVQERTGKLQETNKLLTKEVSTRKNIAKELEEKIKELEDFRSMTIERENEMIEIKKAINQLSEQIGKPRRYSLSFLKKN